ncbi:MULTISPECIES: phosphotransferase family protein [Streptomyces]|uniref:Aminoglycoside phosphotransferase family protein n=1 Tax=Streptomyces spinosisporus TaxID=2927582 RepID=A0ABS9XHI1_9ACTN|nr:MULTISPECIES: aminoglycoside phosphotransferase family protein [Streptomyces]MCI3241501.1 aminoglycoside phosphotransferase family protein [Streptomyces spinosisporus]WUB33513.1 aminoglycoside phosphotransferase family protein [Streptomyces sp. NBC_00588]
MDSGGWGTHAVELTADRVIKRFPLEDGGRAEREWRALTLLAMYAPGLAPDPETADLADEGRVVVMSRIAGNPLRGRPLRDEQVKALAEAVNKLHAVLPVDVLDRVPVRPGLQGDLTVQLRQWAGTVRPRVDTAVGRAMDCGLRWLTRSGLDSGEVLEVPPVFGPGDGNLANYLWDGSRVRVVDFEDSGRSDRAFELAKITEHVGSWVEYPLDVPSFLGHFDLTAAETARLRDCRRLLALVWLFLLALDHRNVRNPPGTTARQADRLMSLLG